MMELNDLFKNPKLKLAVLKNTVIGFLVIVAGAAGMAALANMRKPPAAVESKERPLHVEVLKAVPENIPVHITGYGEVKSLNEVSISPEVSGKIINIHPKLEIGEVIEKGTLLFQIDDSNYLAAQKETQAMVHQCENTIARMRKQYVIDKERLKTIERNRILAEAEYKRIRRLFDVDNVGTQSGVDRAEQSYNAASDQADQMAQTVFIYPIKIKEAENSLASAQARLALAETNLRRCTVYAPFDGRIKQVSIEEGQYVTPGKAVITLADDAVLEIRVPLDSRDARKWLRFDSDRHGHKAAWFSDLAPVTCKIRWTEMKKEHCYEGILHRIVAFDSKSRTLTVAIRIKADKAWSAVPDALPLVDGMFCSVQIPGKIMKQVIALPRHAVSFDGTVYICRKSRLKTVPVEVARSDGDMVYIARGLQPGDQVVLTRLIDPLENALLEVINSHES